MPAASGSLEAVARKPRLLATGNGDRNGLLARRQERERPDVGKGAE